MMQPSPQSQPIVPPPSPAAPATSPKELMNRLLGIMDELSQVMIEEIPIIVARNYTNQDNFIKRKQDLTLDYQSMIKVLAQNQALLGGLSKDDVTRLRESGKKLDEVTEKNATALRSAHHATEHLLKVVINEIRKDLHKESGYSGRGIMTLAESQHARPISVNQRV